MAHETTAARVDGSEMRLSGELGHGVATIFAARAMRGFADGLVSVLLPVYLIAQGLNSLQIGAIATATLVGSAIATLAVGAWGHRWPDRSLLLGASVLMALTGLGFSTLTGFGLLMIVACMGTLNPSSGDVSVFLPIEHARLAQQSESSQRTALFARYALTGTLCAALGALASALPDRMAALTEVSRLDAMRGAFIVYGLFGAVIWMLYRRLPHAENRTELAQPRALGESRARVVKLAALFSLDSFAGGLVLNAMLALWLFQRFGLSLAQAGSFFFVSGLLGAFSQLAASKLAARIGLINTMVFTHIPASLCLIAAAFATDLWLALTLLFMRAMVSSMDVPARNAFVMAVVQPHERAAAASFTAVPRSLAAAAGPLLAGWMLEGGFLAMPLIVCGVLKISYDLMLWFAFRRIEPETSNSA